MIRSVQILDVGHDSNCIRDRIVFFHHIVPVFPAD
jgi:hypothetical protein